MRQLYAFVAHDPLVNIQAFETTKLFPMKLRILTAVRNSLVSRPSTLKFTFSEQRWC